MIQTKKILKSVFKKYLHNFLEPNLMSTTQCLKPKASLITIRNDKVMLEILTIKKLKKN